MMCRDAKTPEEYRLVDGYAEDMRELVSGYQAKVANQGAARQRHGGRTAKRGGKVRKKLWCIKMYICITMTREMHVASLHGSSIWPNRGPAGPTASMCLSLLAWLRVS